MSTDEKCAAKDERIAKLEEGLREARKSHYYCDDCWYSCPLAEDGCCNDAVPKGVCNCGADEANARIDELLKEGKK